jgi:hypothetical protein
MLTTGPGDDSVSTLREALMVGAASGTSGVLRIAGDPGGTIQLTGGLVTAVETAGAPSPEVLLLRSGRLSESGWDAAFAAAASAGRAMSAELIARELVGAGELEALLLTALADAVFVLASGNVEECWTEPGPPVSVLSLEPGAGAEHLLAEASRRLELLASLPFPAGWRRERAAAAPGAVRPGARLGAGRDEILALADGRRTPRDLAFALGRGVYATMRQLAGMYQDGLLVTASSQAAAPATSPAGPRAARSGREPAGLPRRDKGTSRRTGPPRR